MGSDFLCPITNLGFSAHVVKNLPAKQKMQVQSLDQEDPHGVGKCQSTPVSLSKLTRMDGKSVGHDLATEQKQTTVTTLTL